MRKIYLGFGLILIFAGLNLGIAAQSIEQKLAEIDTYAQKVQTDWKVPGFAIGIVKDDKVLFAKGYGVRELGKSEKIDEDTLFVIASNSKAFTTAGLAILIDEGKLKWDDKVRDHLPEFEMYDPYATREMTVRDLVSHRSGLDTFSGDLLWYETTYTDDEIIKRLKHLKPTSSFRSQYGYQNLMFTVAGKVLERVSGKTWEQFVRERILTPLSMNRTTASVKDFKDNFSKPHNESGGKLRPLTPGNVDNAKAAAGLNSSVKELANWIRMQLNRGTFEGKTIFSKVRSGEMWAQNTVLPVNPFPAKNAPTNMFSGYGLGWFLNDYRGKKMVGHGGGLDGMLSYTAMIPEENLGVIVLTNSETPAYTILRNKILDVFLNLEPKRDWNVEQLERAKQTAANQFEENKKLEASRIQNTKPSLNFAGYEGTYASRLYGDATIKEESGRLVLRLIPAPNFVADLEHWHYDTFRIKWRSSVAYNFPPGFVTFSLNGKGKTDELKIDQPNNDFWFYELEFKRK